MVTERQAEKRLFLAYQRTGDPRAREALVERYLPLARSYRGGSEPLEDLEQSPASRSSGP